MTQPDLDVVIVISSTAAEVGRTLRHLQAQTIQARLRLILVARDQATLDALPAASLNGYADLPWMVLHPLHVVEEAAVAGALQGDAPYVALVEDHAFPSLNWAEAVLDAFATDARLGAVATPMTNANPATALSWGNMLLAYGHWLAPVVTGPVEQVPTHNVAFRRAAVAPFGAGLAVMLGRGGNLHGVLAARGWGQALAAQGTCAHANPSTWAATIALRIDAGRLYGAQRAAHARWSLIKRGVYVLAGPLIPLIRWPRLWRDHLAGGKRRDVQSMALRGLIVGLVLDALGQMVGFLLGAGRAKTRMDVFELGRTQHLVPLEWALLRDSPFQ